VADSNYSEYFPDVLAIITEKIGPGTWFAPADISDSIVSKVGSRYVNGLYIALVREGYLERRERTHDDAYRGSNWRYRLRRSVGDTAGKGADSNIMPVLRVVVESAPPVCTIDDLCKLVEVTRTLGFITPTIVTEVLKQRRAASQDE